MISSKDLHGIMAMMPAFATDDAVDVRNRNTVDVDRLVHGVDKILGDGVDAIATTGSFGEVSSLLPEEFETLVRATVETVGKRVPVIAGCTTPHTRATLDMVQAAAEAGADGVIAGVPYYFPSSVENAVKFYRDIAEAFPNLAVLIYHNPTIHHIFIPVEAFHEIVKIPNVVGMKDSHRTPLAFLQLMDIIRDRISVFVQQAQYYPYGELGASGIWSIDAWMGPQPLRRLVDAVDGGDVDLAREIVKDISAHRGKGETLTWREPGHKIAVRYAGYCDPGPLRPPFSIIPEDVKTRLKARAEHWRGLCGKYGKMSSAAQ